MGRCGKRPGLERAAHLYADRHPANVLTRDGTICGFIDFGDLCAGDPACDLATTWLLPGATDSFYRAYEPHPGEAPGTRLGPEQGARLPHHRR